MNSFGLLNGSLEYLCEDDVVFYGELFEIHSGLLMLPAGNQNNRPK